MSPEQAHPPNVTGTRAPLSERDAQHLGALQQHWKCNRTFPSMARLTGALGLSSTAGVFGVIGRLTAAGVPVPDRQVVIDAMTDAFCNAVGTAIQSR